ncbi:hypothetical protein AVEN_126487-1, partial [Araneus ventricosus]
VDDQGFYIIDDIVECVMVKQHEDDEEYNKTSEETDDETIPWHSESFLCIENSLYWMGR